MRKIRLTSIVDDVLKIGSLQQSEIYLDFKGSMYHHQSLNKKVHSSKINNMQRAKISGIYSSGNYR